MRIALAFLFLLPSPVLAARLPDWAQPLAEAAPPLAPGVPATTTRILLRETRLEVQLDGTYKICRRVGVQVLSARTGGVQSAAFGMGPQTRIKTSRGWHQPPEGRVKKGKGLNSFEIADAQSFVTDRGARLVAMDGIERGSLVFFEFEAYEEPFTLNHAEWFFDEGPMARAAFILTLPPAWSMRYAWMRRPAVEPVESGRSWTWDLHDLPVPPEDELGVEADESAPILLMAFVPPPSTRLSIPVMPDWRALSAWYEGLAADRHRVTPEISAWAPADGGGKDLIGRLRDAALGVRDDVRYVAKAIGIGGYQPRAAAETLATRYGDCKDKATLLRSVLAAGGIPSYPVLVNLGEPDTVAESVATPQSFNHMVLAIPLPVEVALPADVAAAVAEGGDLGRLLFFDATDEYTSFGSMSGPLSGQRGLVAAGERGRLVTLPGARADAHRVRRQLKGETLAGGALRVEIESRYFGHPAAAARAARRASSQDRRQAVERDVRSTWSTARVADYRVIDESASGEYVEAIVVEVPPAAGADAQRSLLLLPWAGGELPSVPLGRRRTPVVYDYPRTLSMEAEWKGVPTSTSLPSAHEIEVGGGSSKARFSREGDSVHAAWSLSLSRTRFEPAEFEDLRRLWVAASAAGAAVVNLHAPAVQ